LREGFLILYGLQRQKREGGMITPPLNSKIKVENDGGNDVVVIPQKPAGFFRYPVGVFMLVWLVAWALGWIYGVGALVTDGNSYRVFTLFWLPVWTVIGLFGIYYLYRIFQPAVPEKLVLARPALIYDSGIAPLKISYGAGVQSDAWKRLFQKRSTAAFGPDEIGTLKLRDIESGNRLTIDQGARRFELAAAATEAEREWLFKVLKAHYQV
jgi:hypothetical protein